MKRTWFFCVCLALLMLLAVTGASADATCDELGHDWDSWSGTILANGNTADMRICQRCYTVETKSHAWVAASCTTKQRCSRCGEVTGEDLGGHNWRPNNNGTHTCTTAGGCGATKDCFGYSPTCTKDSTCEYCGDFLKPAAGHDADYGGGQKATCTRAAKCGRCGSTFGEKDASNHTSIVTDKAVAPGCESTGLTEGKHCSACSATVVAQETVAAKGHTEVIDAAIPADCENSGLTEGKHCSVCGKTVVAQESVAAKGHTEVIDAAVPADCENSGLTEGKHCSVCGKTVVAQETVAAKGHTEVTTEGKPASCKEAGLTEGKHCSVCGEVLAEQMQIPQKSHSYQAWHSAGSHTHEAACIREACDHVSQRACTLYEMQAGEEAFFVCPVCGEYSRGLFETVKAACENVDENAIPYGELMVRLLAAPFGTEPFALQGLEGEKAPLYAMAVAYESAGQVMPFRGMVKVSLAVEEEAGITLLRLDGENWTEIACTLENGTLSFETDRDGLFLMIGAE